MNRDLVNQLSEAVQGLVNRADAARARQSNSVQTELQKVRTRSRLYG